LPDGAKVLCSPTVRTQQTVLPLGRKFKLRDEISPQGTVEHALELAQWPTAKATMVMVSHQPLIGQLVSHLLGLPEHEMMIKKGSVWWLRYKLKEGIPQVSLLTVQSPELM
jgi:phosphohistidine phosphatase